MEKLKKISILLTIFGITLFSCKKDKEDEPRIFTVYFDTNGGNSTPENQTVTKGKKVTKPGNPIKVNDVPGLYVGTPPEFCTFDGWYNGETQWNFDTDTVTADITLKAQWSSIPINVSANSGSNIVEKAIAYVKTNPAAYTLLIDEDVSLTPQWIEGDENIKLTLIGLGGERKIKPNKSNRLFALNAWGYTGVVVEVILGNNITLVGLSGNSHSVVYIQGDGSTFTMLDGSKITGNTTNNNYFGNAGAVYIHSGTFVMKGGIITDNKSIGPEGYYNVGGVYATFDMEGSGGTFNMEGGSIFGNTGELLGDVTVGTITMSGDATIGTLTLTNPWSYWHLPITIAANWTGSVGSLNLYSDQNYMDYVISSWENQVVLQAATGYILTVADIAKFPLGNFVSKQDSNHTQPIGNTHEIVLEGGVGVLKAK